MSGTVIFYNEEKRYGFIGLKGHSDVYFNRKSLYDRDEILPTNALVSFDMEQQESGQFKAISVKRIG